MEQAGQENEREQTCLNRANNFNFGADSLIIIAIFALVLVVLMNALALSFYLVVAAVAVAVIAGLLGISFWVVSIIAAKEYRRLQERQQGSSS